MDNDFVPYLCGGVLFSFLIELHIDTTEKFHDFQANKTTINQPKIMKQLIYAIKPDYNYKTSVESSTFKKDVSNYHTCIFNGGKVIPFERDSTKTEFDRSVKEQYGEVLKRMTKFTTECFPTRTNTAIRILTERTLMLIRDDNSIKSDTLFYINENGSPISKKELLEKKDFCFQSFLIGVWHYIITKPTKNTDGRQTFEKLFPKCDGNVRKIDTGCLKPYGSDINVAEWGVSAEPSPKEHYTYENIAESPKTDKKEKLGIKIYYKGGLLEDTEEQAILSFSPEIIDLDENPNISIKDYRYGPICKITTEFQIKTQFCSDMKEIIRLYFNIGSFNISGTTSEEMWISKSKLNNMLFYQKNFCTAWFRLEKYCENEYGAEFLIIGRIIQ